MALYWYQNLRRGYKLQCCLDSLKSSPCIMCVQYIGGIPWVHRGDTMSTSGGYHEHIGGYSVDRRDTMSTSGDVQYMGGIPWVHRGDTMSTSGGYHEYIGGCSVHRGDIMIHVGGYHEYIGDVQYIGGIPWVHRGDIMSTSGGYHEYIGGYHEYIGGWSVHRDFQQKSKGFYQVAPQHVSWYPPDVLMVSLQCPEHPPMYSWYPPTFIMISPTFIMISPTFIMISPDVLNIPRCTHDIPPMYSWYPPMYWAPPMYLTSPDVLNTHYTGWSYCNQWHLKLNLTKTKFMVVSKTGLLSELKLYFGNEVVKETNSCCYLGTMKSSRGSFS